MPDLDDGEFILPEQGVFLAHEWLLLLLTQLDVLSSKCNCDNIVLLPLATFGPAAAGSL